VNTVKDIIKRTELHDVKNIIIAALLIDALHARRVDLRNMAKFNNMKARLAQHGLL
jgi:hypothetical protein